MLRTPTPCLRELERENKEETGGIEATTWTDRFDDHVHWAYVRATTDKVGAIHQPKAHVTTLRASRLKP